MKNGDFPCNFHGYVSHNQMVLDGTKDIFHDIYIYITFIDNIHNIYIYAKHI